MRYAKTAWHHKTGGRGAEYVFQTRARSDSLHRCLQALRPQGTVIDLAFYQGGMDGARLGEEFHHNGLAIRCAQINRMPRPVAHAWDQRRLAQETIRLLQAEGEAIRQHMITHVVPYGEAPDFLRRLVAETRIHPNQLILPAFIKEGVGEPQPIASMPGVVQHTTDTLKAAAAAGSRSKTSSSARSAGVSSASSAAASSMPAGIEPSPPASLTAITISGVVAPAMGAWMIGSSMPKRSRTRRSGQ